MKYQFRYELQPDAKKLQQLALLAYTQYRNVLTEANWKKMEAGICDTAVFSKLLSVANCFVCEDEQQLIGFVLLIPGGNATETFRAEWSYIRLLSVHPGYERQGIGKRLTEICIYYTRYCGEKTIALHTSEFQHAARHIYESMGFETVQEINQFGKKYWVYSLDLTEHTFNGTDTILTSHTK